MDSQVAVPHVHGHGHGHDHHEQEPPSVGLHSEGEEENHHEKKSVLKKVKAKAKKIKDTLKLHGFGHDHDLDHDPHHQVHVSDDQELNEEDDEDEEMVEDPEFHGASEYNAAAVRNPLFGQEGRPGGHQIANPLEEEGKAKTKAAIGRKADMEEVPHAPVNTPVSTSPGIVEQTKEPDPVTGFVQEREATRGQPEVNFERPTGLEEDPSAPKDRADDYIPSNYQSKVADPTNSGHEEAGISQLLHSLNKMNVSDEQKQGPKENIPTVGGGQLSPDPMRPEPIEQENPQAKLSTFDAANPKDNTHVDKAEKRSNQNTYSEKIYSATSAIAEKAVSTKQKIASTLSPVYEKVAEAGSTVMPKAHGPSIQTSSETSVKGQDKGMSVKDYFAEKFRPGEEDKALSEMISEALHKRKTEDEKADRLRMGKVTESEEVKRQLGSTDAKSEGRVDPSSVQIPGKGVVDKLKYAVGSWFGKGQENQESQQSLGPSSGSEGLSASSPVEITGERRLQESGN